MIAVVYVYKEVRDTYVYIVWVNLQECGGNTQYVNKQACLDHLGVYYIYTLEGYVVATNEM